MGETPVDNYYIDAGWGTWGFKATPVCGKRNAEMLATGKVPDVARAVPPVAVRGVPAGRREGRRLGGALMRETQRHEDHGLSAERSAQHLRVRLGRGGARGAGSGDCSDREWADYVFLHDNQPGVVARMVAACANGLTGSSPSATP